MSGRKAKLGPERAENERRGATQRPSSSAAARGAWRRAARGVNNVDDLAKLEARNRVLVDRNSALTADIEELEERRGKALRMQKRVRPRPARGALNEGRVSRRQGGHQDSVLHVRAFAAGGECTAPHQLPAQLDSALPLQLSEQMEKLEDGLAKVTRAHDKNTKEKRVIKQQTRPRRLKCCGADMRIGHRPTTNTADEDEVD